MITPNGQPGLKNNEPVINQEKVLEALMAYGDEKRMQELDYKMTKEMEAGLYCLNCCSSGLVRLFKAFCWTELELITFAQLDESYRYIVADINIILKCNKHIKKYVKKSGYYNELLKLIKLFPDVLTDASLLTTNWEEAKNAVLRFSVIISKICYVDTYTPPTDDAFTSRLRDMSKYISTQWEMREAHTDKETVEKVKMTKRIDGDINSKLKKFGAKNIATLSAKNISQIINETSTTKEGDNEVKEELITSNEQITDTLERFLGFEERTVRIANKEMTLPTGSYELFIFQELFNKPIDAKITDEGLREVLTSKKGQEPKSSSAVADAVIRINKKGKEELWIDEIIKSENSTYWIDPLLRNITPTQSSQV